MAPIIVILLVVWVIFGTPLKDMANGFWSESVAPWESVDAYYYPDRYDLTNTVTASNVGGLEDCRAWVDYQARLKDDPGILRGDYECGVGEAENLGDLKVYRITAR